MASTVKDKKGKKPAEKKEKQAPAALIADAAEYAQLHDHAKMLDEQLSNVNKQMNALKAKIADRMSNLELEEFKPTGIGAFKLKTRDHIDIPSEMRDQLQNWLINNGLSDLVKSTVSLTDIKAVYAEWSESEDAALRKRLRDMKKLNLIRVYEETTIGFRRATIKV